MKILMAALLLSCSAFAYELDATEALLSTIAPGTYQGTTPEGASCEVSVVKLSGKVGVTASTSTLVKRKEVLEGAMYRWNPGNRSFLASVLTTTLTGYRENVLRTIAVETNTQYVVVADIVSDERGTVDEKVECVINLI